MKSNPKRWMTVIALFAILTPLLSLLIIFRFRASLITTNTQSLSLHAMVPSVVPWRTAPIQGTGAKEQTIDRKEERIIQYGGGEGQIGALRGGGHSPVGPEAFAVSANGSLFLADLVNQRILIYSKDRAYLRSITLPGIDVNDIALDRQGYIYVYDQRKHSLFQYDSQGVPLSQLSLDPADIKTRGYFHVEGGTIYFADAAARDVRIATIQDGVLTATPPAGNRTLEGIHSESGRIYSLAFDKGQALQVSVQVENQLGAPLHLEVPVLGLVSATYLGEDQSGCFYIQTEKILDNTIVLGVQAFDREGEKLANTPIPENDYAFWTTRLLAVGADGTLIQFLPEANQAKLKFFSKRQPNETVSKLGAL